MAREIDQGVLRCAEGHAVARVLPSGTLVVLVVYVLVDTGVVYVLRSFCAGPWQSPA